MIRILTLLLAAGALAGLAACDAVPSATASAGDDDPEPLVLRKDLVVEARGDAVRLTIGNDRVTLRAVEMLVLAQAAQRAAFDALTPEQQDLYLSGDRYDDPPRGGPRCYPDGGHVFRKPGGGGTDPCPPPPPMRHSPDLADALYGDYFEVGEHPGPDADWRRAAGGLTYGR